MTTGTLIIFSGLSGTGKSTLATLLASHLKATYLRIDTVEQGLKDVCGISKIDGMGYRLSYRVAQDNLLLGNTVIADSVNPWTLTREEWNKVATDVGARYVNIEIICSDKDEHRQRVESRVTNIQDLQLPTWEEVQKRDYCPWESERVLIDTAGKTINESFQQLISLLD